MSVTRQMQQLLLLGMAHLPMLSPSYWGHLGKDGWRPALGLRGERHKRQTHGNEPKEIPSRLPLSTWASASRSQPSRRPLDRHGWCAHSDAGHIILSDMSCLSYMFAFLTHCLPTPEWKLHGGGTPSPQCPEQLSTSTKSVLNAYLLNACMNE